MFGFTYETNQYGYGTWVTSPWWFVGADPYEYDEGGYSLRRDIQMTDACAAECGCAESSCISSCIASDQGLSSAGSGCYAESKRAWRRAARRIAPDRAATSA